MTTTRPNRCNICKQEKQDRIRSIDGLTMVSEFKDATKVLTKAAEKELRCSVQCLV